MSYDPVARLTAQNAADAATAAKASASGSSGSAADSAATATAQAGIATAQAGIATAQAGIATTQAGVATSQAGVATSQAAAVAGIFAAIQAANLGHFASDAAANAYASANGLSLVAGLEYVNTTENKVRVYSGTAWGDEDASAQAAQSAAALSAASAAASLASVNTLLTSSTYTAVAGAVTNIGAVAGDLANINTVAADVTNINLVAADLANVNAVAAIAGNVTTVAGAVGNVATVAGIAANVTTVAGIASAISSVAGIAANVTSVAGALTNINAVQANLTNIGTVAGVSSDVTTVSGSIASVNSVASNMASVIGATANAINAAASATAASASASQALAASAVIGTYPNSAATYIPQGVKAATISVAGTGGTNSTNNAATFSGGTLTINPTILYDVVGGAVTNLRLASPGLYIGSGTPTLPTVTLPNAGGTAALALTAGVIVPSGGYYWTASADSKSLLLWQNVAGTITAVNAPSGSQIAISGKAQIDVLNALFGQMDQQVVPYMMRIKDQNGALVATWDIDATKGLSFFTPVNLLSGSLPLSVLASNPLSLSADISVGYAERFLTAAGQFIGGIPVDFPASPIEFPVNRARYAEAFPGAVDSTGTYFLGGTFDTTTGKQTLWVRTVATGVKRAVTTSGHALSPQIIGANAVWVDDTSRMAMYAPLNGSDIARPVLPDNTITIAGDSTGQSIENAITAAGSANMLQIGSTSRFVNYTSHGSQRTQAIAARMGVPGLVNITFAGGSIAASGATACAIDYDFLVDAGGASASYACHISVPGPSGAIDGVLQRTWSGSAAVWAFVPTSLGGTATVGTAALPVTIVGDEVNGTTSTATTLAAPLIERLRSGTLAIRTGRNDTTKSDYSQSACLAQIAGMINRMTPLWKQVVVMGVMQTYGWVPTAYGGTFNSTIGVDGLIKASVDLAAKSFFDNDLAFNAALKAQVGASYFDVLANHTSAGLTSTVTLGGTTYTYLTTAGCGDGTHETTTGAANTLTGLLATISAKGF